MRWQWGFELKVFISPSSFAQFSFAPLKLLKDHGISYFFNSEGQKLSEKQVSEKLTMNKCIGLIAGTEPITAYVLKSNPSLKVISRAGVGLDNIDIKAAQTLGIKVYNTPDVLTDAVAELTLACMLNCLRKISLMDQNMRSHKWKKEMGFLMKGKTVGIIGFGHIGRRVAELVCAFGAHVLVYDIVGIKDSQSSRSVSFEELLENADIISLHTSQKEVCIGEKEISRMKEGVIVINTSRGHLVDEKALYEALKSGKMRFAALDVYPEEPYIGPLLKLENVLLTPHAGSYAREARIEMEHLAAINLIEGFRAMRLL